MNPTASETCGCCEGVEKLTPALTANRPSLKALAYRAGTYATFLEAMQARLSSSEFPELRDLTTRDKSDPALALLDGWATVADVLAFYQERLANEGYLRTATERRSILELARLVGYTLRPGVASTVYLAYTLEKDSKATIPAGTRSQSVPGPRELPQSFETSDDLEARAEWNKLQPRLTQPQTRGSIFRAVSGEQNGLYLKGTATNLKPNDALLIDFEGGVPEPYRVQQVIADTAADRTRVILRDWVPAQGAMIVGEILKRFRDLRKFRVSPRAEMTKRVLSHLDELEKLAATATAAEITAFIEEKTLPMLTEEHAVAKDSGFNKLEPWLSQMIAEFSGAQGRLLASAGVSEEKLIAAATVPREKPASFVTLLGKRASIPPPNALRLQTELKKAFTPRAELFPQLLTKLRPELEGVLFPALQNVNVSTDAAIKNVYALRVAASLFAHNLQPQPDSGEEPTLFDTWGPELAKSTGGLPTIALDSTYDQIKPESFIIIDRPPLLDVSGGKVTIHVVDSTQATTMAAFGVSLKVTQLSVTAPWLADLTSDKQEFAIHFTPLLRGTNVYAQSEELPIADEPIDEPICNGVSEPIELNGLYDGLKPGRWLIITGERTDVKDPDGNVVSGVNGTELVMLNVVSHGVKQISSPNQSAEKTALPGDRMHTFLTLSDPLAYCYKRDTLTIYGNVVKATHGETRREVLGNGDASQPMQTFALRQSPLTYLSAPTPEGAESTLVVSVNDVKWHEADSLAGLQPDDRVFITQTDHDAKTKIIFGNGRKGARPPTGLENIRAVYRTGIGKPGNVKAGQVSQLTTRPLGVKEVINPRPASGGADRESCDQARQNAPLAILALDRLVSVRDYADFSRTFAGIGKASAAALSDGRRRLVHVTIAGADDIPIDPTSDLYRNLLVALRNFGDPHQPVELEMRELLSLVISANVRVLPDYEWESVAPQIREALLDAFGFSRREFGQDVTPSEVISAIQRVRGVEYVDLDLLTSIDAATLQKLIDLIASKPSAENTDSKLLAALGLDLAAPPKRVVVELARLNPEKTGDILPAQLATLSRDVPQTLVFTELPR
jgi:Baseplate J-like protein